ncbi:MAG: hypothetical protein SP1CHLAM54_14980 [Chlamydiia bacterium]|nr:hypothetical protein [Chlamydiia bacterium]MCH9616388.1 hypothetical protein [Chlamydiia bacterium]MCH9629626.1 hypothetical protein [Chlamydiia bacterium]
METLSHTPLLNRPLYNPLDLDAVGLDRSLEMVLFPQTLVEVKGEYGDFLQVEVEEYRFSKPLYVPKAFIGPGPGKKRMMPTKTCILERLLNTKSLPYVWGGNVSKGVPQMSTIFPPPKNTEKWRWNLEGIDCSGLLFEAANGMIPRNTNDLNNYGQEVYSNVKRLDICLLPGHMFIVIGENRVIESKHEWGGVTFSDLDKRLRLVDEPFTFRRIF